MSLLEARGMSKRYGAIVALRSADLVIEPGEIHALLGANGAGKSTLVKMLTGVLCADAGTIRVDGRQVRIASPRAAAAVGLAPVYQDPALLPDLTVGQNLRLTATSPGAVREWLQEMQMPEPDLGSEVQDLPLPTLRVLDLARALAKDPRLLVLDEITAALPADLAERVFAVMRQRRERGRSVLFISHRLAEVSANCDRATVLRDGVHVGTLDSLRGGEERIVELMLGPEAGAAVVQAEARPAHVPAAVPHPGDGAASPALEVRDLRVGTAVDGVSLAVRSGEVLGVAALEGQGQDELFGCLAGDRRASGGEILLSGRRLTAHTPYDAIRAGMVLVPPDRLQALLPQRSVRENISAPLFNRIAKWGPINRRDERRRVGEAVQRLSIDMRAARQVRRLSGGNQQKVAVARWLAAGFRVLLCFDPTRGIDIGTKRQIYELLRELAEGGAAVLLFTSELPEIPLVCDRALVLYAGRVVSEVAGPAADEETLLRAAHGLTESEAA
jgi:ribose transport system ATP-binding protein